MHTAGTFKTTIEYVGKLILHIQPDGTLVITSGNQRLAVTPQEAREMLDYLLLFAKRFEENGNGNGKQPHSIDR